MSYFHLTSAHFARIVQLCYPIDHSKLLPYFLMMIPVFSVRFQVFLIFDRILTILGYQITQSCRILIHFQWWILIYLSSKTCYRSFRKSTPPLHWHSSQLPRSSNHSLILVFRSAFPSSLVEFLSRLRGPCSVERLEINRNPILQELVWFA